MAANASPPIAKKIKTEITQHGYTRTDYYAWLKDDNWQQVIQTPEVLSTEIKEYLEAENKYMEKCLGDTKALQEILFKELRARIKEDDSTVPEKDGNYFYYDRYEENQQYPIYCRYHKDSPEQEEVLLNANLIAKDYEYFNIGDAGHSPDHQYFSYSADTKGSEFYTLYTIELATGELLEDKISNIQSIFVWAMDNRTLFYTTLDNNHRPDKVLRHNLGTGISTDEIVYQEKDPGFFVSLDITESNNYILISAHDHVTSEIYTIDAHNPAQAAQCFSRRQTGVEYEISERNSIFYIVTNKDSAEDYKIMRSDIQHSEQKYWQDVYIPSPGTLLRSISLFKDFLVRSERINGLPRIVVVKFMNDEFAEEHSIEFKEEAYELNIIGGYEFDSNLLRLSYTSMTTPTQIFDYEMSTRQRELMKEQEIPSGHNTNEYTTRRLFAHTTDNERVPISLLYKNTTALDGNAPMLLYAYGSYGSSMPASFSTNRFTLVNRGFIYAIAHVRGGMEKGYAWYKEGKLENKANTFKDYLACAQYLIKENFTQAGKIVVHGGSAGGMLVGAVLNMQPDLFHAAIADVPFVDVLNTMSDDELPLTPAEWPEWGNPIKNKVDYENISQYSPYENVTQQAYPHLLVTAGLTDPCVTYWEPAKWVAKLRELKTDNNILVLKMNMGAGHAGASGRFDYLKEVALMYAFLLKVFNMTS
ncbi:MAG: S9 family peptidase [Gammaproteobacteria bacterium]